jgi:hypothetical protein
MVSLILRNQFKLVVVALAAGLVFSLFGATVFAGNPHFVGQISITRDGNSLTVSGKEAGLGNEMQVHIEVMAEAQCINPGGNHPQAGNKESFSTEGDFPVQNGKANFELTLTATFQPDCTPPMSVVFTNVMVCDTEHGVCESFPGPY